MNQAQVLTGVREVLSKTLRREVTDTEPLVSSGLIDSLMILQLIAGIEKKLNVRIDTSTIQPDDFDTVELAVETVERTVVG